MQVGPSLLEVRRLTSSLAYGLWGFSEVISNQFSVVSPEFDPGPDTCLLMPDTSTESFLLIVRTGRVVTHLLPAG
jgi:hypothetical protein